MLVAHRHRKRGSHELVQDIRCLPRGFAGFRAVESRFVTQAKRLTRIFADTSRRPFALVSRLCYRNPRSRSGDAHVAAE